MDREEAIRELLTAIEELYVHYWESEEPRVNPVAFEIGETYGWQRVIKAFDKKATKGKTKNG